MNPSHRFLGAILASEREDGAWIWLALVLCLALVWTCPNLDLLVSNWCYEPGHGFWAAHAAWVQFSYLWTPLIGRGIALMAAVHAMLAPPLGRHATSSGLAGLARLCTPAWRRISILFVCAALLGPGLMIEGVLKNTVGRPRPVQIQAYGGVDAYVPALRPGNQPARHRSFVSSHAATGFAMMALGLGTSRTWRRRWLQASLLLGTCIGAGRVLQGGHFLSDIVFAFFFVWLSCRIVRWIDLSLAQSRPSPPPADSAQASFN